MARAQWTDEFLTAQRQVGDPEGDKVMAAVFADGEIAALDHFMAKLVTNDEVPADAPPVVATFLEATSGLPTWANPEQLEAAARLFNIYGFASLAVLVGASLPQCYTMRTGVRILALTSQLGAHSNRRLHQTAAMVLAVMGPDAFEPRGTGIRQTQKVRLIHAAIRYRILSALGQGGIGASAGAEVPLLVKGAVRSVNDVIAHHGFSWQVARDGQPINQEDLAYTLLTFGHVIPQGMRSLGIKLTDDEYKALLHAWNVSGYIMGVDERLMAHTEAEAEDLFARIRARQAGPSHDGADLTHALLLVMEQKLLVWRLLRPMAPILVRMLNGDETAAMLGLDVRHHAVIVVLHRLTAAAMRLVQFLINPFSQAWQPGPPLAARFGRRVMDLLVRATDDGRVRQVAIPPGWR